MGRIEVQVGDRFGQLVVLGEEPRHETPNGSIVRKIRCRCDCGGESVVALARLRNGGTRSCGCLVGGGHRTHGCTGTPEYRTWNGIKKRCSDGSDFRYGGRGIRVCERWLNSFEAFLADMGERPSAEHSIDRIDNDGDYSPENCRWATAKEQMRNTCYNVLVTHDGETLCVAEWAERHGVSASLLARRLRLGWSFERAVLESSYGDRGFYVTPISKRTADWYREYGLRGKSLSGQVDVWTNR